MRKDNLEFNAVVHTDGRFSIRVGAWSYFIQCEYCDIGVYTIHENGAAETQGPCKECGVEYPARMVGFIQLLDWENT